MLKVSKGGNCSYAEYDYDKPIKVPDKQILAFMMEPVELEEDVTFGCIVNLTEKLRDALVVYQGCEDEVLDQYFAEARSGAKRPDKGVDEINTIVMCWSVDHFDKTVFCDIHGQGETDKYAIEYTPWCELMEIPFKLRPEIKCSEEITIVKPFFLSEMCHEFLFEMTFCGSIEDRDNLINTLKERVDQIKGLAENRKDRKDEDS